VGPIIGFQFVCLPNSAFQCAIYNGISYFHLHVHVTIHALLQARSEVGL
jgi:hypothetical protein